MFYYEYSCILRFSMNKGRDVVYAISEAGSSDRVYLISDIGPSATYKMFHVVALRSIRQLSTASCCDGGG